MQKWTVCVLFCIFQHIAQWVSFAWMHNKVVEFIVHGSVYRGCRAEWRDSTAGRRESVGLHMSGT